MTITYELKIYGRVQHVGFRDRIEDIGRGLGIDGVVYNYKDDTVRILANFHNERKKKLFKEFIKELEDEDNLINIDNIEEKELNTYVEFPKGINRISADNFLELNKKLDEGVRYIKMIFGLLDNNTKILTKMDEKLDLQTEILTKMDEKLDLQTEILTKMDEKLDILNENQSKIIDALSNLNSTLDNIEKKL
ncbi:acylphosphatase [Methanococcus aeolicus]|uniref:acylphosphatase n=1 Tax=Methanococcus aeolicus TaxID=42879 RepID=UPI0021CAB515|nr:acylphosphatase [Methanococcus aeolicus]UXM83995.1 acylphosphatase [Methanococcus aeolicus]